MSGTKRVPRKQRAKAVLLGFLASLRPNSATLAMLLILGGGAWVILHVAPRLPSAARDFLGALLSPRVTATTSGPAVVARLQALQRLETARQVSQHVVEARSEGLSLPDFLAGERLLMVIQTEAIAGIDLSRVSPRDVQVRGRTVLLRLPDPQVLSVRVDDEHSRVYERHRGWLVLRGNLDLERQARLKAQADARRGALDGDAMHLARSNAEKTIRFLLAPLGIRDIRIEWEHSPLTYGNPPQHAPAG